MQLQTHSFSIGSFNYRITPATEEAIKYSRQFSSSVKVFYLSRVGCLSKHLIVGDIVQILDSREYVFECLQEDTMAPSPDKLAIRYTLKFLEEIYK